MAPTCKYQTDEDRIKGRRELQRKYTEKDWHCDVCGCTLRLGNKTKHLKSKKHLKCEGNTCSSSSSSPSSESDLEPREADEDQEPYISEPGVYGLILGSKIPLADSFRTWLFEEVLPSIRKFGKYELKQDIKKKESVDTPERATTTPVFETPIDFMMKIAERSNVDKDPNVKIAERATVPESKFDVIMKLAERGVEMFNDLNVDLPNKITNLIMTGKNIERLVMSHN